MGFNLVVPIMGLDVERELQSSRKEWKEHPQDPQMFQNYADAAANFLVSPQFQTQHEHWFCDPRHREDAAMALICFSFVDGGVAAVDQLKSKLRRHISQQLSACWNCVRAYHEAQKGLKEALSALNLSEETVAAFFEILKDEDSSRIGLQLTTPSGSVSCAVLAEALLCTNWLHVPAVKKAVISQMRTNYKQVLELTEKALLPGVVFFLFSEDADMHKAFREVVFGRGSIPEWTSECDEVLLHTLREQLSLVKSVDYTWYLLAKLLAHFKLESAVMAQIEEFAVASPGSPPGPGFYVCFERMMREDKRTPAPSHFQRFIEKVDLGRAADVKPSQTTASAVANQKYSNLGSNAFFSWLACFQETVERVKDSRSQQECAALFLLAALRSDFDRPELVKSSLEILSTLLRLDSQNRLPAASSVDISLRMRVFQLTTDHASDVARLIRADALSSTARTSDTGAGAAAVEVLLEMMNFTIFGLLSNTAEFKPDEDAVRSFDYAWEVVLSDRQLIQARPVLARAVIKASHLVPYLRSGGRTYRSILGFYDTADVIYTRDDLKFVLDGLTIQTALLMLCVSLDKNLSGPCKDMLSRVYSTDDNSFEGAVVKFIEDGPSTAVAILEKLVQTALGFGEFEVLPGLVRLLKRVFDALYDPFDGIIDEVSDVLDKPANPILRLWNTAWQLMTLSFRNLRAWSRLLKNQLDLLKTYISESLDFCLALLSYFQRIEATMPSSADGQNYGSRLVQEVVVTLESMVPLLKLRDTHQLDRSFRIYKGLIELLHQYHVKTPSSLCDYFKGLAQSMTLLSGEKYAELLATTGEFSDAEISTLVAQLERSLDKSPSPAIKLSDGNIGSPQNAKMQQPPKPAAPSVRPQQPSLPVRTEPPALGYNPSDAGKQSTMLSFFTKVSRMPAPPPQSRLTAHGVTPSAPTQMSMMERVRNQLAIQQATAPSALKKAAAAPIPAEIHPARPAGFNSRKRVETDPTARPKHSVPRLNGVNAANGDEEEDDDDEEEEGVLTTLGRKPRNINNAARVAPGLATRSARAPTPTDAELELRKMRARLSVEPTELHKRILSWDYFLESPYPSEFVNNKVAVPRQFKDVEEYKKVMEPLLHLEAWQGIQRARAENESRAMELRVGKRVNCDEFIDVYGTIDAKQMSEAGISESDIVLIAFQTEVSPGVPNGKVISANMLHCLAMIKDGTISTRRDRTSVDMQLRTYRPGELGHYFAKDRPLLIQRVCSVTTVQREYTALMALQYYDLKDAVLQGRVNMPVTAVENPRISELARIQGLNPSQAQAVENALSRPGFNLIQGPPGTGKTKTILSIAGAFFGSGVGAAGASIGTGTSGLAKAATKRLLICAPSNAAIDEIALRLKKGIKTTVGDSFVPKVVRLGRKDAVNPEVRDLTLEELVAKTVSASAVQPDSTLRRTMNELLAQRADLDKQLESRDEAMNAEDLLKLQTKLQVLSRQIREQSALLDNQRDMLKLERVRKETEYKKVQSDYLANAHIICSTLSGSAFSMLASLQLSFPTVIIDEAAQCVELSALIPLKYGCKQCIMVGDPHQLPPTVLSQEAARLRYEQSMFVRFWERQPTALSLLDTQFRMNPQISAFPASEFYQGKLKDGPGLEKTTAREWHQNPVLSPFRFIEVCKGRQERAGNMSWINRVEADVVLQLVKLLFTKFPQIDFTNKIGVVSPYKSQVGLIKRMLREAHGFDIENIVDVSSVDGFQGQEKDIIIMSCVRAERDSDGIGFLADVRRMNVAITRARSSLWVIGNRESLEKNPRWKRMMDYARYIGMFSTHNRSESDPEKAIEIRQPWIHLEEHQPWLSAFKSIALGNELKLKSLVTNCSLKVHCKAPPRGPKGLRDQATESPSGHIKSRKSSDPRLEFLSCQGSSLEAPPGNSAAARSVSSAHTVTKDITDSPREESRSTATSTSVSEKGPALTSHRKTQAIVSPATQDLGNREGHGDKSSNTHRGHIPDDDYRHSNRSELRGNGSTRLEYRDSIGTDYRSHESGSYADHGRSGRQTYRDERQEYWNDRYRDRRDERRDQWRDYRDDRESRGYDGRESRSGDRAHETSHARSGDAHTSPRGKHKYDDPDYRNREADGNLSRRQRKKMRLAAQNDRDQRPLSSKPSAPSGSGPRYESSSSNVPTVRPSSPAHGLAAEDSHGAQRRPSNEAIANALELPRTSSFTSRSQPPANKSGSIPQHQSSYDSTARLGRTKSKDSSLFIPRKRNPVPRR